MLVREVLGKKPVKGDIGIEIEVEAKRALPREVPVPWVWHEEGSLRGHCAEYVTKGPISCDEKKITHLENLMTYIAACEPHHDNIRTSVHVHCNVLEHTLSQLWTTICSYWLVDNLMVKYCGPEREGCNFCLRLKDAEYIIAQVLNTLGGERPFAGLGQNIRYSSQNLASLGEHGSLEYRAMRGTLDPKLIDKWSTALHTMVQGSKAYNNPATMMDAIYDTDYRVFLNLLFGIDFARELKTIDGWKEMIDENIGMVAEVAYCHDWDVWEKNHDVRYGMKKSNYVIYDDVHFDMPQGDLWAAAAVNRFNQVVDAPVAAGGGGGAAWPADAPVERPVRVPRPIRIVPR
jgi:hypothetical protein